MPVSDFQRIRDPIMLWWPYIKKMIQILYIRDCCKNLRIAINMPKPKQAGSVDQNRINVLDAFELNYWTEKLDVTKVKLKAAVNAVGPAVKDVESYLKKK